MRQVRISFAIDLPTDKWEEAASLIAIKPIYDAFVRSLSDAKLTFHETIDTIETRAKKATTGAKRGRKPQQTPVLVLPPSGEAA